MADDKNTDTSRDPSRSGTAPRSPQTPREDVGGKALSDALHVSFRFLKIAMAGLIALYLLQGFFTVDQDEVKIKLLFGRPVKVGESYVMDSESGWHYCWPWEEVISVPLSEQTLEVKTAFWAAGAEREAPEGEPQGLGVKTDGYLITGDVNIIRMQLRASYRPMSNRGAYDYAFRFKPAGEDAPPPEALLRRFVHESTIETVSHWGVLEVRRKRKTVSGPGDTLRQLNLVEEIERLTREKLREFERDNDGLSLGVRLSSIDMEFIEDPEVPASVKPAFDRAVEAESEKDKLIQEAYKRANAILADARGQKTTILGEAEAYRSRLVAIARADAEMLEDLLPYYKGSAEKAIILRDWHYQRMVEELLGQAEGSFVIHEPAEGASSELRLLLGRPPEKAPEKPGPPPGGHP